MVSLKRRLFRFLSDWVLIVSWCYGQYENKILFIRYFMDSYSPLVLYLFHFWFFNLFGIFLRHVVKVNPRLWSLNPLIPRSGLTSTIFGSFRNSFVVLKRKTTNIYILFTFFIVLIINDIPLIFIIFVTLNSSKVK